MLALQFHAAPPDSILAQAGFLCALILTVNRAGAGDVFFNLWIARIGNFSSASNGDFQRLGDRDFGVPGACRGDFGSLGLEAASL